MSQVTEYIAVGRRKCAVARVRLVLGKGSFKVNDKELKDYFPSKALIKDIMQPIELTDSIKNFDIIARITGGGITGQAGALRLGISRAILKSSTSSRATLKKSGLLTRDSRKKERKKYGQRGARARFQFSKR
ncbi:MAG: 30S ribosomal protein S9 [Candidatus Aureabacteria bacterium]|nr:30S ribosomal protein S9 [Candidatus Auribacterota bacterium]